MKGNPWRWIGKGGSSNVAAIKSFIEETENPNSTQICLITFPWRYLFNCLKIKFNFSKQMLNCFLFVQLCCLLDYLLFKFVLLRHLSEFLGVFRNEVLLWNVNVVWERADFGCWVRKKIIINALVDVTLLCQFYFLFFWMIILEKFS